jgi:hypothetical protein
LKQSGKNAENKGGQNTKRRNYNQIAVFVLEKQGCHGI